MDWIRGKGGRGTVDDESGCTQGGGKKGRKRKGRPRLRWECVERFCRSGREGRTRARDGGGVNMVGGDDSETGLVTKKKGNKNRRPVSVPASPGLQG